MAKPDLCEENEHASIGGYWDSTRRNRSPFLLLFLKYFCLISKQTYNNGWKLKKFKKENKFLQIISYRVTILVCFLPVFSLQACLGGRRAFEERKRAVVFTKAESGVYNVKSYSLRFPYHLVIANIY